MDSLCYQRHDGFWQKLIEGLMIVAIIAADCYSRKRKRENV